MPELEQEETTTAAGTDDTTSGAPLTAREKRDLQRSQLRPLANRRPELYEEDEYTSDEYERMIDMYQGTMASIEEGEIVKAKVMEIRENLVVLDIGFKSEGTVALEEFKDMPDLKPGDEVEVLLEHLEDQEGSVVLSKKKADFMRVWEKIRLAYENDEPVEGTLVKKIKGGVVVDLMGVDAFLPGSQIALRRVPNIDELLGQKYEFKIIKLNKRRRNIVVSRRVILEQERAGKREKLMKELQKDQVRKGVVKNITDFGAFIDLGGVDGLLHITDMSWGRISHPSEMVQIGQELEVKVLDIDWERERISLGLKQLQAYPWKDVAGRYPVGTRVTGKVVSITNYGAFIELEPGIEGLVHISEMSWTRNVRHPSKLVSIGETIEAVVLKVDPDEEKISLGMKQTEQDPWMVLPLKYPVGTRISGKVRNLTSFGAFVEIEPGIDGLIHISDMSWTKRVQHPSEVVKKGDTVDVVILNIDADNKRISLGLKQAEEDPWLRIGETYPVGTELRGHVVRLMDKGVVVDVGNDIEGFVPVSQLAPGQTVADPVEVSYEGMILDMRVLEVDPIHRRIVLSVTDIPADQPPRPETPPEVHSMDASMASQYGVEETEQES
ncbi:MAG TPA: 30S ribosomal protein S1 [Gemmatimonadaceae bacterium]|jgi:small subunit ribosomal protein S1|nr:30S ribosomal protein S1 [Gemmatimonadaceae bacterium]